MIANHTADQAKWAKLDIFNQMGNIYSEVGRSFKTIDRADATAHNAAIARAIDLFDATIQSQLAAKSPKAREVQTAKQQFLAMITDKNASPSAINSLERYFMQFAVAARLKH